MNALRVAALIAAIAAIVSMLPLVAGCGSDENDLGATYEARQPVSGEQGDADVYVVQVTIQRAGETIVVPCVLYNGYRSVGIDCLDELAAAR